jgi:hypothetical protein
MSEDAGIEPGIVATLTSAVRRSNHSARSHPDKKGISFAVRVQCIQILHRTCSANVNIAFATEMGFCELRNRLSKTAVMKHFLDCT